MGRMVNGREPEHKVGQLINARMRGVVQNGGRPTEDLSLEGRERLQWEITLYVYCRIPPTFSLRFGFQWYPSSN